LAIGARYDGLALAGPTSAFLVCSISDDSAADLESSDRLSGCLFPIHLQQ